MTDATANDVTGVRSAPGDLATDVAHALRNALKLGASLVGTWAVALIIRIILPRYLGPALFGTFNFADSLTAATIVVANLGIDTYIRREIPTQPAHATDFFAGTLLLRALLGLLALAVTVAALDAAGKPESVQELVILLGVVQILVIINATYGALLHSAGTVDMLSIVNVGSKIAWGAGIALAFMWSGGIRAIAVAMLAAEGLRTVALASITHRAIDLRWRIRLGASAAVLITSVPFFLNTLAQTVYGRLDTTMMSFLSNDIEVGWYSAASNIASLSMLLSPLISWILLPLSSRAAARSDAELTTVARRATEFILATAFPISLLLGVGADVIIRIAFGTAYAPATASLRALAPTFVLTYLGMVNASLLVRLHRAWALTGISLAGMALAAALNFMLIPSVARTYGPGGAGVGAAASLVLTEGATAFAMMWLLGSRVFDRQGATRAIKNCVICAVVVVVHWMIGPTHAWRLIVDGVIYVALVILWRAVDVEGLVALCRPLLSAGRRFVRTVEAIP